MRSHKAAMLAKETIFTAQDAVGDEWRDADRAGDMEARKLSEKIEKRLAKVRAELEALDRDVMAASWARQRKSEGG